MEFIFWFIIIVAILMFFGSSSRTSAAISKNTSIENNKEALKEKYKDYGILFSPEHTGIVSPIVDLLSKNEIKEFYHVTPIENLNSIFNEVGALLSYEELQKNRIAVKYISNETSHENDKKYGTEDLVKLSFRKIIPMIYNRIKNGEKLALLGIDTKILYDYDDIFFCDTNSTMQGAKYYKMSYNISQLSQLRFDVINAKHGFSKYTPEYAAMQAEVMVKGYIPITYIRFIKELSINDL